MSLAMTRVEREAFLADLHVGVVSVADEDRAPLTLPVWCHYRPGGEVGIVAEESARKVALLRRAGSFSPCVQWEAPPYKYATVEGSIVAIESTDLAGRPEESA